MSEKLSDGKQPDENKLNINKSEQKQSYIAKLEDVKKQQEIEWHDRQESVILILAGLLSVSVLACQIWLHYDDGRTVAVWSGTKYGVRPVAAIQDVDYGSITIELVDHSELTHAAILINGQKVAVFATNEVNLRVFDGDVIELDTVAYKVPVRFRLKKASAAICKEFLLSEIELCGERKELGHIVFAGFDGLTGS